MELATATLADCIDMLAIEIPDSGEGTPVGKTSKRRREPPSGFWHLADRVYDTISACHSGACNIHSDFEARLALSTYLGRSEFEENFRIEILCSLDSDDLDDYSWAEVEVHAHESR